MVARLLDVSVTIVVTDLAGVVTVELAGEPLAARGVVVLGVMYFEVVVDLSEEAIFALVNLTVGFESVERWTNVSAYVKFKLPCSRAPAT